MCHHVPLELRNRVETGSVCVMIELVADVLSNTRISSSHTNRLEKATSRGSMELRDRP